MKNQRGSVTALAILTMTFIGIVIAGLLPMVTNELRIGTMNKDMIEAQYAAEAGAKTAISGFLQNSTQWAWIQNYPNNPQEFISGTLSKTYKVQIDPNISDNAQPVPGQKYTITSTGQVGTAIKQIIVSFDVPNAGSALTTNAAYIGSMTINKKMPFNGDVVCGSTIPVIDGSGKRLPNQANMNFPTYNYNGFKSNAVALPDVNAGKTTDLSGDKYYVDGDLTIDKNNSNINASKTTVIFVNGDINITANGLNLNGKVMLIATGDIITDKNHPNFSDTVLLSYKDISFKNGADIKGLIIAKGNLSFKNNGNVDARPQLATDFNLIMNSYQTTSGGGSGGTSQPYNWGIQ